MQPSEFADLVRGTGLKIFALGTTAFARSGWAGLIPDMEILCLDETQDLELLRQKVTVRSLAGDFGVAEISRRTTGYILGQPSVQEYIRQFSGRSGLFVYKPSPRIERIASELGAKMLCSASAIRAPFEDKWEFRKLAQRLGLNIPAGSQVDPHNMDLAAFSDLQREFGQKLIVQLPDYTIGGGAGTFLLTSKSDFEAFKFHIHNQQTPTRAFTRANVTSFARGDSASLAACVTRNGIVVCPLQRALGDIPEVLPVSDNYGVYVGNEWGNLYSADANAEAIRQTRLLGDHMQSEGFRGIFGVDVIVDASSKVTVIECNSRYTNVFPMLTMLHQQMGVTPLDVHHLAGFLDIQVNADFVGPANHYRSPPPGAQLVLHNRSGCTVKMMGEVKAGVYSFAKGIPQYLRPGLGLEDLKQETELVLTDGPVLPGGTIRPGQKICRLLFRAQISNQGKSLTANVKRAINSLYQRMQLQGSTAQR